MLETPKVSDSSLVYMYGVSDFWSDMFQDSQLVENILHEGTVGLAEAYSYFLQRSSGISLDDIQQKYNTRIQLLLLSQSDLVSALDLSVFRIPDNITSAQCISNRPILPTETLDVNRHFEIDTTANTINFTKPITEYKFTQRVTSTGEWQYAVWLCDAEIDDRWIDDTFGRLVGFTSDDVVFNYKSFINGVYYLYTNGPNIKFIERGVNLAMGMPYVRVSEEVLNISQDVGSGNWFVFTPTQAYEVPYGLYPEDVILGQTLTEGEVLSTWIQIIDYVSDGAWWYEVYLPPEVVGEGVDPVKMGKARPGTTADIMMETFLKHHMFEVLITQGSGEIERFNTIKELVVGSKPSYTFPIFVWSIPVGDELIELVDDFSYRGQLDLIDTCVSAPSIRYMDRSTDNPDAEGYAPQFIRGINWYNRIQGSEYAATLLGYGDWPGNAGWAPEFDDIGENYRYYMAALLRNRGALVAPTNRGQVLRGWRGFEVSDDQSIMWHINAEFTYPTQAGGIEFDEKNLIPLYNMTQDEFILKMQVIDPRFQFSSTLSRFAAVDAPLQENYNSLIVRNEEILLLLQSRSTPQEFQFENSLIGLDPILSTFAYQTFIPKREDVPEFGTLFFARINDFTWSVYLLSDETRLIPTLFPVADSDETYAVEEYDYSTINQPQVYPNGWTGKDTDFFPAPFAGLANVSQALVTSGNLYTDSSLCTIEDNGVRIGGIYNKGITCVWLPSNPLPTVDEKFTGAGAVYTLTESVSAKEDILVYINDATNPGFTFDYTVSGTTLTLGTPTGSQVIVRYVLTRTEETIAGPNVGTVSLGQPGTPLVFTADGTLWPTQMYRHIGNTITFNVPEMMSQDLIIRYYDAPEYTVESYLTRDTVAGNLATLLMDRDRPDGTWVDHEGTSHTINRSGVYGSNPLKIKRRLR